MVESLFFHQVQGKRYLGSKQFLNCSESQFAMRVLLVVGESLRCLTEFWMKNLNRVKKGETIPLFLLYNPCKSDVHAVLQNIAHSLVDPSGRGRMRFIWGVSCRSSTDWFSSFPAQVEYVRHILLNLSALIYHRHVNYWQHFPWPLVVVADPQADPAVQQSILSRWDRVSSCCVRPGLARELKKLNVTSTCLKNEKLGSHVLQPLCECTVGPSRFFLEESGHTMV